MKIACLGWGSLIWDPRTLPVSSDWLHDGPLLPVEFTRQSNDGRITLAITPDACAVKVFSALLDVVTMDEACRALAEREGIPAKFITRSVIGRHRHSQTIRRPGLLVIGPRKPAMKASCGPRSSRSSTKPM